MRKQTAVRLDRLRELREDAGLSQARVAELLGTSQTMYSRYERGAVELPVRHLRQLCRILKTSADYLLGLTKFQSPYCK